MEVEPSNFVLIGFFVPVIEFGLKPPFLLFDEVLEVFIMVEGALYVESMVVLCGGECLLDNLAHILQKFTVRHVILVMALGLLKGIKQGAVPGSLLNHGVTIDGGL